MSEQIEKLEENKRKTEEQLLNIERKRETLISNISKYEYQIKVLKFEEIERIMQENLLSFDDALGIIKISSINKKEQRYLIPEGETVE